MHNNVTKAKKMLKTYFNEKQDHRDSCACHSALEHGVFADLKAQNDDDLRPIYALVERFL